LWALRVLAQASPSRSGEIALTQVRLLSLRREAFTQATTRNRGGGEPLLFLLRRELLALARASRLGEDTLA